MENSFFANIEIILPAFVAGLMICLTHAPLGIKVLEKGIIFIDLAIAQIAGLGLVFMQIFFPHSNVFFVQFIALSCALAACLFFYYIAKYNNKIQEAIIGCSFVLAASLTVLLLTDYPMGGEEIKHILSGQMLLTTWLDVLKHLPIYVVILALWFLRPKVRNNIGFYILFACAITSSVQLVGIYVVFASLILPALAANNKENKILIAILCGISAMILGVFSALIFDLPAGGVVVISYVVVACFVSKIKILL